MKCLLILVSCLVAVYGQMELCKIPAPYQRIVKTRRSGTGDDDKAIARCPPKFHLAKCECEGFDQADCDGAMTVETKDGYICMAQNGAFGKGVVAVATCNRFMINCHSTIRENARIRCPKNFTAVSCTIHSHTMHKFHEAGKAPPFAIKDGGSICKASPGCKNCSVSARCMRNGKFFN